MAVIDWENFDKKSFRSLVHFIAKVQGCEPEKIRLSTREFSYLIHFCQSRYRGTDAARIYRIKENDNA